MKQKTKKKIEPQTKQLNTKKETESLVNTDKKIFDGNWIKLVSNLKVGLAKSLAQECALKNYENDIFNLTLNDNFKHLAQHGYIEKLEEELINHFNKKIKIKITIGSNLKTPSAQKKMANTQLMEKTESAIMEDDFVKELIDDFGAEIITSSIEPTKKKEN